MSISTIQKTRERNDFSKGGATFYTEIQAKEACWAIKRDQTYNLSTPRVPSSSFRDAAHGKRVVFPLRSSERGQLLLTKLATFPVGTESPGPRQCAKFNTQGNRRQTSLANHYSIYFRACQDLFFQPALCFWRNHHTLCNCNVFIVVIMGGLQTTHTFLI